MYSTEELPLQDRQDFWNPLYTSFCRTICEKYKVEGEAVSRGAVRAAVGYGKENSNGGIMNGPGSARI